MTRALALWLLILLTPTVSAAPAGDGLPAGARDRAVARLVERHGEIQRDRIRLGVAQVADRWWPADGNADSFVTFCSESFIPDEAGLARTFERLQRVVEQIDGHLHEVRREITTPLDLDTGEVTAVDRLLATIDLQSHVDEDLFNGKVAFLALLNYPVHTLAERLSQSGEWDRVTWARSRMMDRFASRVPAAVSQEITAAFTRADQYVADYNIRMDRLVASNGTRPFPEGMRLITHWGLRDELKSHYSEGDAGLVAQRTILDVMRAIVRQSIPQQAIDNPDALWAPHSGEVWQFDAGSGKRGKRLDTEREPDTRYEHLLGVFRAVLAADRYSPTAPTYIDRRFNQDREIPEAQVEALLVSVLESPAFRRTAERIRARLGRPLEPFDIWYDGFKARGAISQSRLDEIVAERYPDVASFQHALPEILAGLGFSGDKADWLADRIVVDPSRGAGHAMGAVRREDAAHLRTRFGDDGMDYKGYNIAVHELGHNVEQVFSLNRIDHWWLNGVPNTAFTEALAFVFQNRDLELLGLATPSEASRGAEALDTLWGTAEIGGVALVDMAVWRWMYAHPDATPAQLREATLSIARDVWNRYFAPVFGHEDAEILAVYSHMIVYGLYLPDYPIGHIIAFQVADALRRGDFGSEFERVSRQGRLTPDAWMRGAVGERLSAKALLNAANEALAGTED